MVADHIKCKTHKNKGSKKGFCSDATEEPFLVHQRTFQWSVLKIKKNYLFLRKEGFYNLNLFSTIRNFLCSGKISWMLKVLHGTINANQEPLFLRVYNVTFQHLKVRYIKGTSKHGVPALPVIRCELQSS